MKTVTPNIKIFYLNENSLYRKERRILLRRSFQKESENIISIKNRIFLPVFYLTYLLATDDLSLVKTGSAGLNKSYIKFDRPFNRFDFYPFVIAVYG